MAKSAHTSEKVKAATFVYLVRPILNRFCDENVIDCPVCGKLLQKYSDCGYLHLADGDADCYGAIGYGKGL
jgi:hypothetical protein